MSPSSPLRIGIVPYLNVLPLLSGLDSSFPAEHWTRATPRELAHLLNTNALDVATLPLFDALRAAERYVVVPGCAIACDGPVRSVQIFSHIPLEKIRNVVLDRSSLTSVHLAQVLLADLLGLQPNYTTSPRPLRAEDEPRGFGADAAVVIGDAALQWERKYVHRLDLGEGWKRLTGLPFVFAAWVAREDAPLGEAEREAFVAAREQGERSAAAIADAAPLPPGLDRATVRDYLTRSIRYRLGEREWAAVEEFRRRLLSRGLLPAGTPPLRIWDESGRVV